MDEDLNLVREMVRAASGVVERDAAINGVRALCREFGGQQLYIPRDNGAKSTEDLRGILSDAVDGADAEKIIAVFTALFGGFQHYIPMEKKAFRDVIAHEIYVKYGTIKMRELCREYDMSFSQVYRLWHEAREQKLQMCFPFMEELGESKQ
jgi:Mor family transcriptional regulator